MSKFGLAFDCGDGRTQGPSRKWLKTKKGVKDVDKITVAGLVKRVAERDSLTMAFIEREARIYLTKHDAVDATVSAHGDCAGNRTTKKRQLRHLRRARRIIYNMIKSFNLGREVNVHGLWVNDKHWMPEEIDPRLRNVAQYHTKVGG